MPRGSRGTKGTKPPVGEGVSLEERAQARGSGGGVRTMGRQPRDWKGGAGGSGENQGKADAGSFQEHSRVNAARCCLGRWGLLRLDVQERCHSPHGARASRPLPTPCCQHWVWEPIRPGYFSITSLRNKGTHWCGLEFTGSLSCKPDSGNSVNG